MLATGSKDLSLNEVGHIIKTGDEMVCTLKSRPSSTEGRAIHGGRAVAGARVGMVKGSRCQTL